MDLSEGRPRPASAQRMREHTANAHSIRHAVFWDTPGHAHLQATFRATFGEFLLAPQAMARRHINAEQATAGLPDRTIASLLQPAKAPLDCHEQKGKGCVEGRTLSASEMHVSSSRSCMPGWPVFSAHPPALPPHLLQGARISGPGDSGGQGRHQEATMPQNGVSASRWTNA